MYEEFHESFAPIYPGRLIPLHAMLLNCGHQLTTDSAYCWDGTKRGSKEMLLWQYTIGGCGNLRFGNKEYLIEPGSAVLLKIPEKHCYYFKKSNQYWEFYYVTLNGSEIVRILLELRKRVGSPILTHQPGSETLRLAKEIFRSGKDDRLNNPFDASAASYRFTMELVREFLPSGWSGETPAFIDKVRDYCLTRVDEELTVDELAEVAGYSRFHFIRQFHKYYGMSPMDFVTELKMRVAVRLLQTEKLTVKEVADRCGFASTSYFCKVFLKHHGKTPAQFRDYR